MNLPLLRKPSGIFSRKLIDEIKEAVKIMLEEVILPAKKSGVKIGVCGQVPSGYPEFAQSLVENGIDSISFIPDALLKGIENKQE